MKIGLIADTHMPGSIANLWPQALDLLKASDVILHAGDLHTLDIVDELEAHAPVYVARGNGDAGIEDERLKDAWLLEFAGVSIGMIHHFPSPQRKSAAVINRYVEKHFEQAPQILVYGHTHLEGMHHVDDMLCINPGSPTLPRNQSLRLGTLGLLDIADDHVTASLYQLTESGFSHHDEHLPIRHGVASASDDRS